MQTMLPAKQISALSNSARSFLISGSHCSGTEDEHSSPLSADQFYRVSIAAIHFISDLVNCKFPLSNGMEMLSYSKNCMIDTTRTPTNIRSSNVRQTKRESFTNVPPRPSVSTDSWSKRTSHHHSGKCKVDKSNLGTSFKRLPSSGTKKLLVSQSNHERGLFPYRTITKSNHIVTNFGSKLRASSTQMVESIKESYNKHLRDLKMSPGVAPMNRHFMNTGHCGSGFRYSKAVKVGSCS
ncbi:hypothetical protein VNO80_21762 [Phaseolus coccineus]|uniref:Uncharacterized protein n=1 Tax=Phaseolus coccineus TaxID=3886 RepID=A0AAN9M305_PHACN